MGGINWFDLAWLESKWFNPMLMCFESTLFKIVEVLRTFFQLQNYSRAQCFWKSWCVHGFCFIFLLRSAMMIPCWINSAFIYQRGWRTRCLLVGFRHYYIIRFQFFVFQYHNIAPYTTCHVHRCELLFLESRPSRETMINIWWCYNC